MPEIEGSIIITWPWFVDLSISRVLAGQVEQSPITVLAVLNSKYVDREQVWHLRRNTLGMFNVLRSDRPKAVPRCAAKSPPAQPYIGPAEGRSLEDYRREGEESYSV
ncbi:MAG: hypothetical protein ACKO1N_02260 [Erythrobacter sp.]